MKRCKHPGSARVWPFIFDEASGLQVKLVVCGLCCTQLPLGPAADDSPAVEIRAAEIAAAASTTNSSTRWVDDNSSDRDEWYGWLSLHSGTNYGIGANRSMHAGYLARIIYEHM